MFSWDVRKVVENWGKNCLFSVLWAVIVCCFLVLEVCFALQCDLLRRTNFPTFFYTLSLSIAVKNIFLFYCLEIPNFLTNLAYHRKMRLEWLPGLNMIRFRDHDPTGFCNSEQKTRMDQIWISELH